MLKSQPKRNAEADAHVDFLRISKRTCCTQQDHASTTGCPEPPYTLPDAVLGKPERKSIYAIMRQHCRSRLYVPPICWTLEHLELLGCEFSSKEVPQNERRRKSPNSDVSQVSDDGTVAVEKMDTTLGYAVRAARLLSRPCAMEGRVSAVISILAACGIEAREMHNSLPFHFDRRIVSIQTDGIFTSESATVSLAYINLDVLHSLRSQHIRQKFLPRTRVRGRLNSPVASLIRKNICRLKPENEIVDPYIVAALIALAQHQYRRREQLRSNTATGVPSTEQENCFPRPFKVHLLAVPGIAARELYLYAARIPPAFLDKFDQPSKFSPSGPISVAYYSLPLRNARKLPKRLLDALCAPVE
ncbi:unnamed protein product [Clonostachys rosea f. rosea IK726]|nr:unnamed protein product [Clonostachys rosea f. rosea IK726]